MTVFNDPDGSYGKLHPPVTVLRGPDHADNYRIKVGRYKERWYIDPLPGDNIAPEALSDESYPSVSTVKSATSGKDWTFTSLQRVAHADDLEAIAKLGYFERYERLKVINQVELSRAQRRGTNVHTWAEALAYGLGPPLGKNVEGAEYFDIVDKLFADLQPELVAAEFVCIHRRLNGVGYGGTADGIFKIGDKRYKVDWKSRGADSDHGAYPEEGMQLGAYLGAEYVIVADDDPNNIHGAKRIPVPQVDGALIISIKPDSYEVFPVDVPKAIELFEGAHAWWLARREETKVTGRKWAPRRVATVVEPDTDLTEQLQESINIVKAAKDQRKELLYARYDALTADEKDLFDDLTVGQNTGDLDIVESVLDEIKNPPKLLDLAKKRMAKDQEREAARRLAEEGGPANPDDVNEFEARWELTMTDIGRRWLGALVTEATEGGVDFRLSTLNTQRRADIYCALTEWASVDAFNAADFTPLVAAIAATGKTIGDNQRLSAIVGSLTTDEAAALRMLVTEIGASRLTYITDPDGVRRWMHAATQQAKAKGKS